MDTSDELTLAITNAQAFQVTNDAAIETYLVAFVDKESLSPDMREGVLCSVRGLLAEDAFRDLIARKAELSALLTALFTGQATTTGPTP